MEPSRLLVFIHIPKTAGTTLTSLLRVNEPGRRTLHGVNVFQGGGGVKQDFTYEGMLANEDHELDQVRFLTGHFPLGIRDLVPANQNPGYFTVLREPTDRVLSHFFQIRARRGGAEEPNKLELPPLSTDATLEEALEGGYVTDNLQTRMLCGDPEPFGEVTGEMLEQAKLNLRDDLVFFGLTERFDESLVLAKRRLGLTSILYRSPARPVVGSGRRATGRVNTVRPRGDDVPAELRRTAEDCSRYDIELYEYAAELFDAVPEREDLEFAVDVAALRVAKADDGTEPDAPIPAGFGGDAEAWRMLISAKAELLRHEHDLGEIRAFAYKLGEEDEDVHNRVRRMRSKRRRRRGTLPDTALDTIKLLARAQGRAAGGGRPESKEAD